MGDAPQNAQGSASKQRRGGGGAHGWLWKLREEVKFGFELLFVLFWGVFGVFFLIHTKDEVQRAPSDL